MCSVGTAQGDRAYNQDVYYVSSTTDYPRVVAVFDGHGKRGEKVSSFLKRHLIPKLLARKQWPMSVRAAKSMFHQVGKQLSTKSYSKENGSTAICVVQYAPHRIQVLNCGDCRAVMSRHGLAIQLTRDHKPGRHEESIRIKKLNGSVITDKYGTQRLSGKVYNLAVSRSFGDGHATPYLTNDPDVFTYELDAEQDEFIIIASDGLWDELANDVAVDAVRRFRHQAGKTSHVGQDLVNLALETNLVRATAYAKDISRVSEEEVDPVPDADNITAVVLFFPVAA